MGWKKKINENKDTIGFISTLVIACVVVICSFTYRDKKLHTDFGDISNYRFKDKDINVHCMDDVVDWCFQNINYRLDSEAWGNGNDDIDYWQSPDQTYYLKAGDGEDICILFMYLCYSKLNLSSNLVVARNKYSHEYHSLVKIGKKYFDIVRKHSKMMGWKRGSTIVSGYDNIQEFSYEETLWMACYYHKNVSNYVK